MGRIRPITKILIDFLLTKQLLLVPVLIFSVTLKAQQPSLPTTSSTDASPTQLATVLPQAKPPITVGAAQLELYLPLLQAKRVGLVVNQTSLVEQTHLVDFLLANDVDIQVLFAPEHGIRGDAGAGEKIENSVDEQSGIVIQSIYGEEKRPPDELMQKLDVIVFDIQDVGTRFYTYISSMHYMMEAAAIHGVSFIVLDRPNPNAKFVDGPVLKPDFQSFVGMHPIPLLHGMTVGELALMIKAEGWIEESDTLELQVIPVNNYHRNMPYSLAVPPSPNLPNDTAIALYPSLCLFEATAVSIGRGTDFPFQVFGHHQVPLGGLNFTPESKPFAAPAPKLEGERVRARDLRQSKVKGLYLTWLVQSYKAFERAGRKGAFFTDPEFFDKLAGSDELRIAISEGQSARQIKATWQDDIAAFKEKRKAYLLYED